MVSLAMTNFSSSSSSSIYVSLDQTASLHLPSFHATEIDTELSITHLLKAYGEAMEMKMASLAEEILIRLKGKACPTGSILQRLAYYLNQALDKEMDYFLSKEAAMNYEIAFYAFYQIIPLGRFAHFTANSVIVDAIPEAAKIVHIIDFDIDKCMQWPPIIEALSIQPKRVVKLTSIKWEEENTTGTSSNSSSSFKNMLYEYARNLGVKFKMEEMNLESLASEMKKIRKRGGNEWLAFNCMVGLPHMENMRNAGYVLEFLKVAKESISNTNQGSITFGDGIGWGKGLKGCNGYGSIFEGQLSQYKALLEAMDTHFPNNLMEARLAIECLFLVPYISCLIDTQMWEDISKESRALSEVGLKPWAMKQNILIEGKELVKEGQSYYWVDIQGLNHNQMVLGYVGTPLVKVSSWR